ncbi:hypothetical protein J2128_002140 [Methanomicrobium sp. W14]|nr:hypothetical protein [Methanomicrobium sp. W14]
MSDMNQRIEKVYEALFAIEDIREVFRKSLPAGPDVEGEKAIQKIAESLKGTIDDIEYNRGNSSGKKIGDSLPVRDREEAYINIQPIQAAGRLTADARKAIISYGDGYSACDQCRKPFRLDKIEKPCIAGFHRDLASFLNMDEARVVPGATKQWKFSTYGLTWEQVKYLADSFDEIAEKYGLEVKKPKPEP